MDAVEYPNRKSIQVGTYYINFLHHTYNSKLKFIRAQA